MQGYIKSKGKEFLDGIDDKALSMIANNNDSAITTSLLAEAAASTKNAGSLAAINQMLGNRTDISISGSQLANYGVDTIAAIQRNGGQNIDAILSASDDISKNPKLISKLDPNTRAMINTIRRQYSKQEI